MKIKRALEHKKGPGYFCGDFSLAAIQFRRRGTSPASGALRDPAPFAISRMPDICYVRSSSSFALARSRLPACRQSQDRRDRRSRPRAVARLSRFRLARVAPGRASSGGKGRREGLGAQGPFGGPRASGWDPV